MEIVLLVGVAAFIAYYFLVYKKEPAKKVEDVPYKLEAPAEPTPVPVTEKPANDHVEAVAPVVAAPAKKRVVKPKVVAKKAEPKPKAKPATKTTKIKRTK
jgi:hypothetical protein